MKRTFIPLSEISTQKAKNDAFPFAGRCENLNLMNPYEGIVWSGQYNLCCQCNAYDIKKYLPNAFLYPINPRHNACKKLPYPYVDLIIHMCCNDVGIPTEVTFIIIELIIKIHIAGEIMSDSKAVEARRTARRIRKKKGNIAKPKHLYDITLYDALFCFSCNNDPTKIMTLVLQDERLQCTTKARCERQRRSGHIKYIMKVDVNGNKIGHLSGCYYDKHFNLELIRVLRHVAENLLHLHDDDFRI
jgi:hypothetical protein